MGHLDGKIARVIWMLVSQRQGADRLQCLWERLIREVKFIHESGGGRIDGVHKHLRLVHVEVGTCRNFSVK